jgi:hypothetical protein
MNQTPENFGPLAFLHELRVYGGLAHTPNKAHAAGAAAQLGLPSGQSQLEVQNHYPRGG